MEPSERISNTGLKQRECPWELVLVVSWLDAQRPQHHPSLAEMPLLRGWLHKAWQNVQWNTVCTREHGYWDALNAYFFEIMLNKLELERRPGSISDAPALDVLDFEIKSITKLQEAVHFDERRSELRIAARLIADKKQQTKQLLAKNPCPDCRAFDIRRSDDLQLSRRSSRSHVKTRRQLQILAQVLQPNTDLPGQAAVSRAARRLERIDRTCMDAEIIASSRQRDCCILCLERRKEIPFL